MSGRFVPRSRKETRATVLESLLRSKGSFRPTIAAQTNLTEASVSRIISELRQEKLVAEQRVSAARNGGPTTLVTFCKDVVVLGIELSNSRLSLGIGGIGGALDYVDRSPASLDLSQAEFERGFIASLQAARDWTDARGVSLSQAAMSIPGYGREAGNPIVRWDTDRLAAIFAECWAGVPFSMTNSVVAQAAFHRYAHPATYSVDGDHLFLFVGHGVAGVIVNQAAAIDAFSTVELGHMVIERGGLPCRCGHRGCLEAYASLRAVSEIVGIPESDILAKGDRFLEALTMDEGAQITLRERQFWLGLALGNALNLHPVQTVVISGWPSLTPDADRSALVEGLNESLLGGFSPERLTLTFIEPSIGNDPKAALAYAAYCFVRSGGVSTEQPALKESA